MAERGRSPARTAAALPDALWAGETPSGDLDSLASPRRQEQRYEHRYDEYEERDARGYRRKRKKRSFWDVIEEIID